MMLSQRLIFLTSIHSKRNSCVNQRGFTLVELSIVLIIISLIVGGVLVGQDLIRTAKRQQAVKQVGEFNLATMTFKNKYGCLPGDCTSAQGIQFGFTAHPNGALINGNNNGSVCERGSSTDIPITRNAQRYECRNYWWQLSQTKLINWTTADTTANCSASVLKYGESTPPIPFRKAAETNTNSSCVGWLIVGRGEMNIGANAFVNNNHAFLMMGGFANWTAIASGTTISSVHPYVATLTPEDAFYIDNKLDDGLPMSGRVRAIGFYQDISQPAATRDLTSPFRGNPGTAVCIDNSVTPNLYNTISKVIACNLSIEADF